jgi:hypothetical protein
VYAVADAESTFNVNLKSPNYAHDKHGNRFIKSTDYGLMQINSKRINHDVVRDSAGHDMKIDDSVIRDWKANARAGVAIVKHNYDLVGLADGPGASREDIALGTYSAYNHGTRHWHKFLERGKDGMPKDAGNRNFLEKYHQSSER